NAWQAHSRLFTGSAVGALTSETRGQNSWLNYGPYGESNRTASVEDTVFADQKAGLMPEWTWTEGVAGDQPKLSDGTPKPFEKFHQKEVTAQNKKETPQSEEKPFTPPKTKTPLAEIYLDGETETKQVTFKGEEVEVKLNAHEKLQAINARIDALEQVKVCLS
ncbi:MAG: hypothetical protein ACPHHR_09455, partial [Cycloclasticus sp.]